MLQVQKWRIELQGHSFDLEDLPLWMSGEEYQVVREEDSFYLDIPAASLGPAPEPILPFAQDLIEQVNGIGSLLNPSFRLLTVVNKVLGLNAEGQVISTSIQVGGAELRVKAGMPGMAVNGVVQPDPRLGSASPLLRAAREYSRAKDALVILSRPSLTWSELYLLFELVEGDVGGKMFDLGWVAKGDADRFTRTANSYSALGSDGRHGKDRGQPPPIPMPKQYASGLVKTLVLAWLKHLGASESPPNDG